MTERREEEVASVAVVAPADMTPPKSTLPDIRPSQDARDTARRLSTEQDERRMRLANIFVAFGLGAPIFLVTALLTAGFKGMEVWPYLLASAVLASTTLVLATRLATSENTLARLAERRDRDSETINERSVDTVVKLVETITRMTRP